MPTTITSLLSYLLSEKNELASDSFGSPSAMPLSQAKVLTQLDSWPSRLLFFRARCASFHIHSSHLIYFLCFFVLFHSCCLKCLGKHSCLSSTFPIAILNDTCFFPLWKLLKIRNGALLNVLNLKVYLSVNGLMWLEIQGLCQLRGNNTGDLNDILFKQVSNVI